MGMGSIIGLTGMPGNGWYGFSNEAMDIARRSIDIDSTYFLPHNMLGESSWAAGRHGEAVLVDRGDHLRDEDPVGIAPERVTTARATDARHEVALAQPGEELFEIGQRDPLALSDVCQRDGPTTVVDRQIEHCSDRIPALCRQPHKTLLRYLEFERMIHGRVN